MNDSGTAPFMLWNFPTATTVTVTGGDSIEGTIYAPNAYVNWQVTQNIEGNVIAARFTHGVPALGGGNPREVHSFPFSADVTCTYDDGVVPPPPTPTPTPTPIPTPTTTPTPPPAPGPGDPGDTGTAELADSGSDGAPLAAGVSAAAVAVLLAGAALAVAGRRSRRDGSR